MSGNNINLAFVTNNASKAREILATSAATAR
jgi:hypothetical protein